MERSGFHLRWGQLKIRSESKPAWARWKKNFEGHRVKARERVANCCKWFKKHFSGNTYLDIDMHKKKGKIRHSKKRGKLPNYPLFAGKPLSYSHTTASYPGVYRSLFNIIYNTANPFEDNPKDGWSVWGIREIQKQSILRGRIFLLCDLTYFIRAPFPLCGIEHFRMKRHSAVFFSWLCGLGGVIRLGGENQLCLIAEFQGTSSLIQIL